MAQFNLNDYETVEERLRRFWADEAHADARLVTINHTTNADRQAGTWVVEARLYLNQEDQARNLPKTTGWAFEVDGVGMANKTSALENAETSSLGRCLANYTFSGNKRVTREEMEKVARGQTPKRTARDFKAELETLSAKNDLDALRLLYSEAKTANASTELLEEIKTVANGISGETDTVRLSGGSSGTGK
jgi:hypothetical protein